MNGSNDSPEAVFVNGIKVCCGILSIGLLDTEEFVSVICSKTEKKKKMVSNKMLLTRYFFFFFFQTSHYCPATGVQPPLKHQLG